MQPIFWQWGGLTISTYAVCMVLGLFLGTIASLSEARRRHIRSTFVLDAILAREIDAQFDQILVDEYQDTNVLQAEILRALRPSGAGLTVVGDDAQAIYSFRAATVENILGFPAQFAPPAQVVTLSNTGGSALAISGISTW